MLKNFFKVVYRNAIRNKGFSIINITGLAVGMAAAILILLWIHSEVSFDTFHSNKNRIYEVWNRMTFEGKINTSNGVSEPLARVLEKEIPEVERAVRVTQVNNILLSSGDKKLIKSGRVVDTGFLQVFTFPMLQGNPATALNDQHGIVLTENTARSLFANEDAIGKMIRLDNEENFTVTAVLKDPPTNTRFSFDYLLPRSYIQYGEGQDLGWSDNSTPTYVLLKPNVAENAVAGKIKTLKQLYSDEAKKMQWELFLYPLKRWHLYSSFTNGVEDGQGLSLFITLFGVIAAFILLIACINFMNLSTARSEKRAREVGIRKVVGARKYSLVGQFIGESVMFAFISGIVAILLVQMALPSYNQLIGKNLVLDFANIYSWITFAAFVLFTGFLAGSYPAFFLSSFRPVKVLKGTFKQANKLVTPRKVLVVLQYSFATLLIICTIIVKQQIDFARARDAGYNKDNLLYHFMTGDISRNYNLIKNELLSSGTAKSITKTNSPLTERWSSGWGQSWEGKDPGSNISFDRYLADEDLGSTAGLQFVQGRDFNLKQFPTDSSGLIINESALKIMNFKNPIGKVVGDLGINWHVVGVVKDFILTSPYEPTRPILICGAKSQFMTFSVVNIKLNGNRSMAESLSKVEAVFKKYNPDYPFEIQFVDASYAKKFENVQTQGILAALFAGLTIFISCMGLFGLASAMAENRVKEIGVRKVLGASVTGITSLLSKDFVKLVLISFIIAAPVSYWGMHEWLQNFHYRATIEWWVFAFACMITVAIALITVGYQAIRAALSNPVKSLRTE